LISGRADLIVPSPNENVSEEFRHSRRCAIPAGSIIPGKCLFGVSIRNPIRKVFSWLVLGAILFVIFTLVTG
jgi:hypothetical protein